MLAAGALIFIVALTADQTGLSQSAGMGAKQLGMMALSLTMMAWGWSTTRPDARQRLQRVLAVVVSTYLALWLVELLLAYPFNPRLGYRLPSMSVPGMYEPGTLVSLRHVPGYQGVLDDGIVQVPVAINSKGDRDGEPRQDLDPSRRVLLIGDSMTFGYGLPHEQAIDARIEAQTHGEIDAYNLGVMGYGPGDTAQRFEEAEWWRGRAVIYVFFENDLRADNSRPGLLVAYDGWAAPRFHPSGRAYTHQEWDELVAYSLEHGLPKGHDARFALTFTLQRLRSVLARVFDRNLRLTGYPGELYSNTYVDAALEHTERMRELAAKRGASFTVLLLPAIGEAIAQERTAWSLRYIDGLAERGIDMVDPIEALDADDYLAHDPHLNAAGANVVAAAIVEHLGSTVGTRPDGNRPPDETRWNSR